MLGEEVWREVRGFFLCWVFIMGVVKKAKICIGGNLNCACLMFGIGKSVMRTFNIVDF